jgi:hypothetical protein
MRLCTFAPRPGYTSSPILSPQTLLPRHGATRFRSQCQHLCGDAAWDCSTPPFQDREKDRPCLNLFAGCVSSCAECRSDGISGPFHRVLPLILMLSTMEASDGCLLVHTVLFCLPCCSPAVSHTWPITMTHSQAEDDLTTSKHCTALQFSALQLVCFIWNIRKIARLG